MQIKRQASLEFKAYNAMISKTLEQNGTMSTIIHMIRCKEDVDILRVVTKTRSTHLEDALNSTVKDR